MSRYINSTEDWGTTHYSEALVRQQALVRERINNTIEDRLIITEHKPVYTIGKHPEANRHLLWDEARLKSEGIEVHETNRGGDITYHGPGQLVVYPIVDLSKRQDLHAYLRLLEEVVLRYLECCGVAANRREGLTGIWVQDRKIAAIGVAVGSFGSNVG